MAEIRFITEEDLAVLTQGPPGEAATVEIGSVTDLAYGETPTVTNSGTDTHAILDFEIPSGPQGVQGDPGADGADGADGNDGAPGADGEAAFVYIGYASDDTGTGFSLTPSGSLKYIAILSTDTEILSPGAGDFTGLWVKYIGDDGAGADNFLDLTDTPNDYTGHGGEVVKVNVTEDGLEFGTASAVASFLDLTDVPASYTGEAGKFVRVTATEDGLEFVTAAAGVTDFTDLGDVPSSYSGQAGKVVQVTAGEDGLEFGVVLASTYQPLDADLTAIAAVATAAYGRSLLALADATALAAEVDSFFLTPTEGNAAYQPLDSDLTSWAGVTRASGFDTFAATPSSANLKSLVTDEVGSGALVFATSPRFTTDASPASNDSAALGTTALGWSDLHLATGAVINWANGEVTLTETDANTLTLVGGTLVLPASGLQVGSSNPFSDSSGTLTLQNVDVLDGTTESTIEAAIDTLANLTSIQGVSFTFGAYAATLLNNANEAAFKAAVNLEIGVDVQAWDADLDSIAALATTATGRSVLTLADPNLDRFVFWDDSAGVMKLAALADIATEASPAAGDYVLVQRAEDDLVKVNWSSLPGGSGLSLAQIVALMSPATMSESSGNLTFDVDDGNNMYRTRTMAGNETLLDPVDQPSGTIIDAYFDPTGNSAGYPTIVTADDATSETTSDGTAHTITMPSNVKIGDLIMVGVAVDGNPTITINTATSGLGWQAFPPETNGTTVTSLVLVKIAEGSDALALTTSASEQLSAIAIRITNFNRKAAVEAASTNGSSTNSDPPNLAMSDGVSRNRLWVAWRMGDAQVQETGTPAITNYTTGTRKTATNAAGASISYAWRQTAGSSENPGAFTSTTEQWTTYTVGVDPSGMYELYFGSNFRKPYPILAQKALLNIKKFGTDDFGVVGYWEQSA